MNDAVAVATGQLNLVSVGPGFAEHITPAACEALNRSEVIVGYELYTKWIGEWITGKEILLFPLTKERERVLKAIELARQGKIVALISSGDIGVYAMAGLAFEEMSQEESFSVCVVPGVTAANACGSLLGSPLTHDFATLSLSDLLCPWSWIEERAWHLAAADMTTVLYNVQSKTRQDGVYKIIEIMLEHKSPGTLCGVVRNAYRPEQKIDIYSLKELLSVQFDMFTSIVIGNRFTRRKGNWLYTPRGYNSWSKDVPPDADTLSNSVWVFSGTSDGNALAKAIADSGRKVVISAATEYGGLLAKDSCPSVFVLTGKLGVENRRHLMEAAKPLAVVDATHPYAVKMSEQLIELTRELGIPYIRFERMKSELASANSNMYMFDSVGEAAAAAVASGKRIFLATGSKDIRTFLSAPGADQVEWFTRLTPDPEFIRAAVNGGIPRSNICAMQGPFSRAFNEAIFRDWNIDLVVTKESGAAGGFTDKVEAASSLNIPVFVIKRPRVSYPTVAADFASVLSYIDTCGDKK